MQRLEADISHPAAEANAASLSGAFTKGAAETDHRRQKALTAMRRCTQALTHAQPAQLTASE